MSYLRILTILLIPFTFYSCDEDFPNARGRNESRKWPKEPCKEVSWSSTPCITHGFIGHKYDTVILKTYEKNSKFDHFLKQYTVIQDKVSDKRRKERGFSFPDEITSNFDIKICFKDSLIYNITNVKAGNYRVYQGWICGVLGFEVNGESFGHGNIILNHPNYTF